MKKYYIKKAAIFSLLILSDIIGLYGLLLLSWLIRNLSLKLGLIPAGTVFLFARLQQYYFVLVLLTLLVFSIQSLYFSRSSFYNEYKKLIKSALLLLVFWGFFVFIFKMGDVYSRFISFMFFGLLILVFPFYRKLAKTVLYHVKVWRKDVMVIGDGFPDTLKNLLNDRVLGYCPRYVQIEDAKSLLNVLDREFPRPVSADLILIADQMQVDRMEPAIKKIEFSFETIRIFSGFSTILNYIFFVETNLPSNMFVIKRNLLKPHHRFFKRIFDLSSSLLLTVALSPLLVMISVLLLMANRGRVFYVQDRIGFKGQPFKLIKFKTMVEDSEAVLESYLKNRPEEREKWHRFRKLSEYDPRVTRIGRILRKFSLDELPQLINIIKGDMSVVGPRPYLKEEISGMALDENILYYARPGLTGLWQVMGRNEIDLENRFMIDEYYIRNWDFWIDLYVLMKTPFYAARGK